MYHHPVHYRLMDCSITGQTSAPAAHYDTVMVAKAVSLSLTIVNTANVPNCS